MWIVIIVAFVLICIVVYIRSLKNKLEYAQTDNIRLHKERDSIKKELDDCNVQLANCTDIIFEFKDSNNKLLKQVEQLEEGSKPNINYSKPLTDYYNKQDKLLQELTDVKNRNALLIEEAHKTETSYKLEIKKLKLSHAAKMRIAEERHQAEQKILKERYEHLEKLESNLTAIPYLSAILADYETYGLEILAKQLDWGWSMKRMDKVASIREIRKTAKEMAEKNLESKYQLAYLLQLFPALEDIIETDFKQLPVIEVKDLSEYDKTRDWLSKEEYQSMESVERNQLALDRYKNSHTKSKWQIGRDYELYVGYMYSQKGYTVDYYGSYMGLEDLGRDLIAKKGTSVLIIQCKYWGQEKTIHEKHITQLYGTMICYCLEKGIPKKNVKGVLVTNIQLSEQAKKMAAYLKIQYKENCEKGDYPCIKCNIGRDEFGETKIYHLPFDQQYDSTKINSPGEFFAMTVKEAEAAGFRRAFKWFNN